MHIDCDPIVGYNSIENGLMAIMIGSIVLTPFGYRQMMVPKSPSDILEVKKTHQSMDVKGKIHRLR